MNDVILFKKQNLATMNPASIQNAVNRKLKKLMDDAEERDEYGSPTEVAVQARQSLDDYLEEQRALFASRRQDPNRALRDVIIPTGEYFTNRYGEKMEIMRIVALKTPLEIKFDDESNRSVTTSHSYSQGVNVNRDQKRGKYNDAGLLIEQSAASVDPSEVVPFTQACV